MTVTDKNFSSVARKRARMNNGDAMDVDENENGEVGVRTRSKSRNRSQSHIRGPTRDKSGMRPAEADKVSKIIDQCPSQHIFFSSSDSIFQARKMMKKNQREMNQNSRIGEADRRFMDKKPKHLFSGKRGMGKTDRR